MQGKRTKRGQRGGLNRRKRSGGGFFYLSNEGIFLVENAAHLVLPVPEKLKLVLEQPHDRSKKNSIKPMRATANNRRSFFMAAHNI